MKINDYIGLRYYELKGIESKLVFHFPVEGIHEKDYCDDFLRIIIDSVKYPTYVREKMRYLMTFRVKDDKSKFLKSLGYSENGLRQLFRDIYEGTYRDSIKFSHFSSGKFIFEAQTTLKGKIVKTVWKLEDNLDLFFITLVPGGYKKWKK